MNKNYKIKIRKESLYKKYNNLIIPNKNENKINETNEIEENKKNDYYCKSCTLKNNERNLVEHKSMLGWPINRKYDLDVIPYELNYEYSCYEEANIAKSIITENFGTNKKSFSFSPLFTEKMDLDNQFTSDLLFSLTNIGTYKKDNFVKSFPNLENLFNTESINNGVLYHNINSNIFGNIWIELTGSRDCDFAVADQVSSEIGLFGYTPKGPILKRPKNYTWHHVYMGWFAKNEIYVNSGSSTEEIIESYSRNGCLNTNNDFLNAYEWRQYWNPLKNFCLMQLVFTDVHEFCVAHSGAVEQYKKFCMETTSKISYCKS